MNAMRYFLVYSFLGYVLEKLFARVTRSPRKLRRCFIMFPLCPVYGLAMLAVLALPREERWWQQAILGALAATAVEYGVHWAYERALGVRFWDYRPTGMDLGGRVCLPFSAAWGLLSAAAVTWVHPAVQRLCARMGDAPTDVVLLALAADALCSVRVLLELHDTQALRPGAAAAVFRGACAQGQKVVE